MIATAYAKINLGLRVLNPRPDGFHNLETVFTRVMPFDEIELTPANEITLECNQADVPADRSNLVLRAAYALHDAFNPAGGVAILLRKNIPTGAGLGGGSSDAATTLFALNQFWNLGATHLQLHDIASGLGSDVPYFLTNGAAAASGRGEILEPIDLILPYWIVIVYPGVHVSTAWAYANLLPNRSLDRTPLTEILESQIGDPATWIGVLDNDFESPVFSTYPAIRTARERLYQHGALFVQLSGSGSSVYGVFNHEPDLREIQRTFPADHQVFVTPPHFRGQADAAQIF